MKIVPTLYQVNIASDHLYPVISAVSGSEVFLRTFQDSKYVWKAWMSLITISDELQCGVKKLDLSTFIITQFRRMN